MRHSDARLNYHVWSMNQRQHAQETTEQPPWQSCSSITMLSLPWVFSQRHPLDTSDFIREAERRGFDLDLSTLRELYRHGLLAPLVAIHDRRVGEPIKVAGTEPERAVTRLRQLRMARDGGKLQDLAAGPFRPHLAFERAGAQPHRWWNGLLYSWHQLLSLPRLRPLLTRRRRRRRGGRLLTNLPSPDIFLLGDAARFRRIAIAATALEARYLPVLNPEWIHLSNAEPDEWQEYRSSFDAEAVSKALNYTAVNAREDAEFLLVRAHSMDPLGRSWGQLVRRAPRDAWKDLKDAALSAMDLRETAEILLLFYEDLVEHGGAEALPDLASALAWHPLHERLSYRRDSLDQDLMRLGISPHPRVVLAVEGETEQIHIPQVWKALGCADAPEVVRVLKLGGADHDLKKVAALAAAPLVGPKVGSQLYYPLIKPPTQLLVAIDPDRRYGTPQKVERERLGIVNEIRDVLKAQGATAPDEELDHLVEIRTWSERCYEFAHFNDEELADALAMVHSTLNGSTREELVASIAAERERRKDIKEVWSQWDYGPSKTNLAEALWPILERKIHAAMADETAPLPEIAEVVQHAYMTAQRWRYHSFALTAAE